MLPYLSCQIRLRDSKLIRDDGTEIDVSDKIQKYTFEAGMLYDFKISQGEQKNTNTVL